MAIKHLARTKNFWMYVGLAVTLCIGLALRLYGVKWGLPDVLHPNYSYHPDEMLHLAAARWLADGRIIDRHFIFGGTFYFSILNSYIFFGDQLAGLLGGFNKLANSILFGRYFLVGIATITILLVYESGRQLFNEHTGLLAAFFLAITPAHIVWAQRVRPDEIAAFLLVIILFLSAKILSGEHIKSLRYLVFAGLAVGVATSLRFPMGAFVITPLTAYVMMQNQKGIFNRTLSLFDRNVAVMFICAAIAFFITSPHVFMYPDGLKAGIKIQWRYQSGIFLDAVGEGPGIYQYGWLMLHQALGYAIYFLAAMGMILALFRRSGAELMILATVVSYFVLMTLATWIVVRYTLPLLPLFALLAAGFVFYMADRFLRYRLSIYISVLLAVVWTLLSDIAYLRIEAGRDVRDLASEWISENVPEGSSILTVRTYREDYYFNPVVPEKLEHTIYYLVQGNDSQSLFRDYRFDYVILHEYIYKSMERLGKGHPLEQYRQFHEVLIKSPYRVISELKNPVRILGLDFSTSFASNDYTIVNPGIRIYRRE